MLKHTDRKVGTYNSAVPTYSTEYKRKLETTHGFIHTVTFAPAFQIVVLIYFNFDNVPYLPIFLTCNSTLKTYLHIYTSATKFCNMFDSRLV